MARQFENVHTKIIVCTFSNLYEKYTGIVHIVCPTLQNTQDNV